MHLYAYAFIKYTKKGQKMKAIFYFIIFAIGTVFGSFSTLAIYRIPLKKNITTERSFCPNCNHKLGIFDLIPVLSYIFLGGKCRYCGKRIKPTYLIIELLMGFSAIGIFLSLNVSFETINIYDLIKFLYLMIFATTLVLIAGIDKKQKKVSKPIIFVGCLINLAYIIYLCVLGEQTDINIYRYVIYFAILFCIAVITSKYKLFKYRYLLEILMICIYINMFEPSEVFLVTTILTMISLTCLLIVNTYKDKADKSDILAEDNKNLDIPIAMFLCISNIVAMIVAGIAF